MRAASAVCCVVVFEEHRCELALHVEGDVVGEHPQEHVRTDPVFCAMADRTDVQVGVEAPKGAFHVRERLVGRDDLGSS